VGKQLEESVRDNRAALKEMRGVVKELTERCIEAKHNIDNVKVELDRKQDERRQNVHVPVNSGENEGDEEQ
jgi:hypothetical protein